MRRARPSQPSGMRRCFRIAQVLKSHGAESVSAFVTHGIFPRESYKRFLKDGDRNIFDKFFITNSNPTVTVDIPEGDCFEILDITDLVIKDL